MKKLLATNSENTTALLARLALGVVNDLKLGGGLSGAIGLWVEVGTEGVFSDLKIYKE